MEEKLRELLFLIMKEYSLFNFLISVKFLAKNKRWRSSRWVHSGPLGGGRLQFHVVLESPGESHLWRYESGPRPVVEIIKVVTWVHSE
jgi:hypothetical protein